VESWLAALIQSEHLSLLVGNGLTTGASVGLGLKPVSMNMAKFDAPGADKVDAHAERTAKASGRGSPNIEDQLRSAQALIEGLRISDSDEKGGAGASTQKWLNAYDRTIHGLVNDVVSSERQIGDRLRDLAGHEPSGLFDFLLSFASRPPTRERLELFTTNYDRLLEHVFDTLGVRIIDRFVGSISPSFRASRVNVDLHFDPPGIRGEPRYLEGVVRLTKLHGSLDWRLDGNTVRRIPLPFGPESGFPRLQEADAYRRVMIYPNAAKDVETLAYPYAELFRDFAGALCRPNSTLFTYGYGFGDDHINRVLREMLSLSSTHLVIMSFDGCGGRLESFCKQAGHDDQVTLLVGSHFAALNTLTRRYLPRTLVETVRHREAELSMRRGTSVSPTLAAPQQTQTGGASDVNAS
jgi:hypothetical protein